MEAAHAFLPPSKAEMWGACAASPAMESASPLAEDEAHVKSAVEGRAAHHFAERMLRAGEGFRPGDKAPNGIVADMEMLEAVEMYCGDVRSLTVPGVALHIEERVDIPAIHRNNWGTPDCWLLLIVGRGGRLIIWDFKYGHGFVDAFINWQMMDYACGILDRPEFRHLDHSEVTVDLRVVQPRNYDASGPIRHWEVKASELAGYWTKLKMSAKEAHKLNARARINPKCGVCLGRHRCITAHRAAENAMDVALAGVPLDLEPTALGVELRYLRRNRDILDARISGLEAEAKEKLRAGAPVPFFALARGLAREDWTTEAASVLSIGDAFGVSIAKPATPLTPNQARKAFQNAGLDEELLTGLYERPPGAVKLIEMDAAHARKVFS